MAGALPARGHRADGELPRRPGGRRRGPGVRHRHRPPGETVHPFAITPTHLAFEEYDVATQIAYSHHYWVEAGQLQTFSAPFRYVWPSELDLMARLAGLTLKERWADWTRAPFTSESRSHVSVWQKAGS
jgi:hypothetical protein